MRPSPFTRASAVALPLLAAAATSSSSRAAHAAEGGDGAPAPAPPPDVRDEVPTVGYAYGAAGARRGTLGIAAYGLGLAGEDRPVIGGGVTVWGSPVDRLTLVGDAQRDGFGQFAPSLAAIVRLFGQANDGWVLGALAKGKAEGFGSDPDGGGVQGEIEGGLLLSHARRGWHTDLNAIVGFGLGDSGEVDGEGRLRVAYDLAPIVRFGVDGQARFRFAGKDKLPGDRTWDFTAGPELIVGTGAFFGALTAGPSTMGLVSKSVGWTALAMVGAAAF